MNQMKNLPHSIHKCIVKQNSAAIGEKYRLALFPQLQLEFHKKEGH